MPFIVFLIIGIAIFLIVESVKTAWPFLLLVAGLAGVAGAATWAIQNYGPGSQERLRAKREEELRIERAVEARRLKHEADLTAGYEALAELRGLDANRKTRTSATKAAWDKAQIQLEGRYSWANATGSSAVAIKRLEYLSVAEPEPELMDCLPKTLPEKLLPDESAQKVLQDARRMLAREEDAHRQREKERLSEIENVKELIETLRAEEKRERLALQDEVWADVAELDPEIRAIDGIAQQVEAYNTKLESDFHQLRSSYLRNGLAKVPRQADGALRGSRPIRSEPASPVDKRIETALKAMPLPMNYHAKVDAGYLEASRQALIEIQLPDLKQMPLVKGYKYTQSANRVTEVLRPASEIKNAYTELIAQFTLLAIAFAFAADKDGAVESLVLNGYVDTIDPRSGHPIQPCLISVRATRSQFEKINLHQVDAQACLKHLSASVSRSPSELAPVRPILDFQMFDPRFITATDAISALDARPNLMDLTPAEFEGLIQNLFEKMGLEARQTQASRDGGVDCIAYDNRPIFGGKVVIQAKRYKNTVGVSAVRDLYGTLQNEGASKGILVTTSGYGAASFEFAQNKPIELLEGSHLLYLLKEHAGIDARIEAPNDWRDPVADFGETY